MARMHLSDQAQAQPSIISATRRMNGAEVAQASRNALDQISENMP